MYQRDVVLRWIEQIALVVRRMLYGPGPPDLAAARTHLNEAISRHLGSLAQVIPRLDPAAAAALIGDRDRILGLALLLDLQASIQEAEGDRFSAAATRERAEEFRREASERAEPPTR